jgi:hypothetical protein
LHSLTGVDFFQHSVDRGEQRVRPFP